MNIDSWWPLLLAVIIGTLAVGRATRLIVDDDFPPVVKLRTWLAAKLPEHWVVLLDCPFCTAPYLAAPAVIWFASLIAFPDWTVNLYAWWIINGWAAVSYLAAMITMRDIPESDR